jgi:RecJ-like exonuclease
MYMKQNPPYDFATGNECWHCDGTGEIETDNNGPIGECPLCGGTGKRPKCKSLQEEQPCT